MNRCNAFNKNNKKCRCIIKDNKLFCSDSHKPINDEIINDGCFMCMENIVESKDIIYFKCKHAFHKPCYLDWLKFSTYSKPICMICRTDVLKDYNLTKNIIKQKLLLCNTIKINELYNILNIKKFKKIGHIGYLDPIDYIEYTGQSGPNIYLNNIYQDSIESEYTGQSGYISSSEYTWQSGYIGSSEYMGQSGYIGSSEYMGQSGYTAQPIYNTGNTAQSGYTAQPIYNTGNTAHID